MKKFNATKIAEILNDRFGAGIGHGRTKANFDRVDDREVIAADFDRGPRQDHGGADGEGWMCPTEVCDQINHYLNKYKNAIQLIELTLENSGYSVELNLDYGEKGHVSICIYPSEKSKVAKAKKSTPKKSTKKVGVLQSIRTLISKKKMTKDEIVSELAKIHTDRDATKMAKTVSAQLPSRIVPKGKEMVASKNAAGITAYRLFNKVKI